MMLIKTTPQMKYQSLLRLILLLLLMIIGLWLSGCVALETNVTIYQNEQWKTELVIAVPPQTMNMAGGEIKFEQELELPPDGKGSRDGVNFAWEKDRLNDGTVVYTIISEGQDFDKLNEIAFDSRADISLDAQGQINLRYRPNAELITYTLRVTGGKIITSNADRVEGKTAIWNNPDGEIRVRLTGASSISPNLWLAGGLIGGGCLCLGLLVLIAGSGFFLYRRRSG